MLTLILAATLTLAHQLDAIIDKAVANDAFSGVVMLARDGAPIYTRAVGDGINPDTKFNVGSINKIFTKIAIEQLAKAGKLSLNDTVRKHLPDYPSPAADKITIEQLLEHRSGLGDFFGPEFMAAPPNSIRTLRDYLRLFAGKPLLFEPGTEQRYSNAGYIVLGLIIERVSGQSYFDYVRDHIFRPAGMTESAWYAIDADVPNRAAGMTKRGPEGPLPKRQSNAAMMPGRGSSAGGGYSTAADLLKFANWYGDKGLAIAGGAPGVNAIIVTHAPYTLVVLSNYDPPSAEELAREVRPLIGDTAPRRRAGPEPPEEVLIRARLDVPFTLEQHLPVIEAKVNGKGPFRFAVDTGHGGNLELRAALADELKLPVVGEVVAADPSGRNPESRRMRRAESVDVGTIHLGGVDVGETSARGPLQNVDGVIGLGLFHSLVVTIDYPHSRFRVGGGSLPPSAIAYTTEHGIPSIDIEVAGRKMKVDVDSGSPAEVTLPLDVAKTLPLAGEPKVVGHGRTLGGEFDVYAATLAGEVRVGNVVLKNPRLDLVTVFPHGNLGSRFLRNLVVSFDPANRRVRFEYPSPP